MNTKNPSPGLKTSAVELTRSNRETEALQDRAGLLGRTVTGLAVQREAANTLTGLRKKEIQGIAQIRGHAIDLAVDTAIKALTAEILPMQGALATQMNVAAASVDKALTNTAAAETFAHFTNRKDNLGLFDRLHADGTISQEEAQALKEQVKSDCYTDINRTRERTTATKDAFAVSYQRGMARMQLGEDSQ